MDYAEFLAQKRIVDPMTGMADVGDLPAFMFPHQRDIVAWALRRGRSAIFAGTGLGKTAMELVWGEKVAAYTGKPVLIFAPLAVSLQHIREAGKFGLSARIVKDQSEVGPGVNVTNYQKIGHFDLSAFGGVCLDESSILKSVDGHYRTRLIEECATIPFRLAATATPAPNDFMELGNHAEFLGVMSYTDMLATFFIHDGGDTQKWRLKGHAENEFWKWMAAWAVMLRKPSDLGYPNDGYDLPPLVQNQHVVGVDYAPSLDTGLLFPMEARSLSERISARRDTVTERVAMAASIVNGSHRDKLATVTGDSECGSQNTQLDESSAQPRTLNTARSATNKATGSTEKKKPNTCASIGSKTSISGSELRNSKRLSTNADATDTPPTLNTENKPSDPPAPETLERDGSAGFNLNTGSPTPTTPNFCDDRTARVPSAAGRTQRESICTSITATIPGQSEGSCAAHAIPGSGISRTIPTASNELSSISAKLEPWVVWCQLNSEQDALEKAFAGRCISVRGAMTEEAREDAILAWLRGDKPILISKPSICGFGLNFQQCHNSIFVGLNDSFEQVYQAVRRFWRFGQAKPVNVHFIAAETEGAVVANLKRKEADAERMAAAMVHHMADLSSATVRGMVRDRPDYNPTKPVILPDFLRAA